MIKTLLLKLDNRYHNLALSAGFALFLLLARTIIAQNIFYWFLAWNLFLGAIPYIISQSLLRSYPGSTQNHLFFLYFGAWLLFLPNSPYIITDLIHLGNPHSSLRWIDPFLISFFACNALLLGLLSVIDMRRLLRRKFSDKAVTIILFFACMLSGYGIYLGRFLRFNSWDLLIKPLSLFEDIFQSLQKPMVWAVTFGFGTFMWILFLSLKSGLRNWRKHQTLRSKK